MHGYGRVEPHPYRTYKPIVLLEVVVKITALLSLCLIALASPAALAAEVKVIDITERRAPASPGPNNAAVAATSVTQVARKKPAVVAHRGGKKTVPENTMAAFRAAIEQGADGIELDIHKAKSGELVVIHDADISRTTDGAGHVPDMTWAELQTASAGAKFDPKFASERIPLLSDVLKLVNGKVVLNIEVKNWPKQYPGIDDDLIAMLKSYPEPEKIIISSFDHELLRSIHEKAPQYTLGILDSAILYEPKAYGDKIGAKFWHPDFHTLRRDVVRRAKETGMKVIVWTVNDPKEWQEAIDMRVDGIVTDDPAGLRAYLAK